MAQTKPRESSVRSRKVMKEPEPKGLWLTPKQVAEVRRRIVTPDRNNIPVEKVFERFRSARG